MEKEKKFDFLIVGAGISGLTIAERLASKNKKVLVIDKRNHIGGNCYDFYNCAGVLTHKYGPHYFRTNYPEVLEYLSKFTEWIPHKYKVKVRIKDQLFSFPINKKTLEQFFNKKFETEEEVKIFIEKIRDKTILDPKNAEEQILSKIGREIYEKFFKNYSEKQWGIETKELDASVTARIPIRYSEDDDYVRGDFQAMPKEGYSNMFKNMISNENITIRLNTNYSEDLKILAESIIFTGPIDEYYNFSLGKLSYRSLKFIFIDFYEKDFVQEEGQINYPEKDTPYTRIVEIKHVTKQQCRNTTISIEIPTEYGEPYYPIPTKENEIRYKEYEKLAEKDKENKIYFVGRLGKYKYLNMDESVKIALDLTEEISKFN